MALFDRCCNGIQSGPAMPWLCRVLLELKNAIYELIITLQPLIDGCINIVLVICIPFSHELAIFSSRPAPVLGEQSEHVVSIHKPKGILLAAVSMVAAPRVAVKPVSNPGPERIPMNILNKTEKIRFSIAQDGFVSTLEKMADRAVSPVEIQGIRLINPLHDL